MPNPYTNSPPDNPELSPNRVDHDESLSMPFVRPRAYAASSFEDIESRGRRLTFHDATAGGSSGKNETVHSKKTRSVTIPCSDPAHYPELRSQYDTPLSKAWPPLTFPQVVEAKVTQPWTCNYCTNLIQDGESVCDVCGRDRPIV